MKIYRLSYRTSDNEHNGYYFYATRGQAKSERAVFPRGEKPELETINVEITEAGVLRALNMLATHPNNG